MLSHKPGCLCFRCLVHRSDCDCHVCTRCRCGECPKCKRAACMRRLREKRKQQDLEWQRLDRDWAQSWPLRETPIEDLCAIVGLRLSPPSSLGGREFSHNYGVINPQRRGRQRDYWRISPGERE